MYKVAFHLGRGAHYMHWQIKDDAGNVTYVNPNTHSLVLTGCKLKNQKSSSLRIFNGYEKLRCAWVQFESYQVVAPATFTGTAVQFNPRVCPTWRVNGVEGQDDRTFGTIKTTGNQMYA